MLVESEMKDEHDVNLQSLYTFESQKSPEKILTKIGVGT